MKPTGSNGNSNSNSNNSAKSSTDDQQLPPKPQSLKRKVAGEGESSSASKQKVTSSREYACKFCTFTFSSKQGFGGHQNAHRPERLEQKNNRIRNRKPAQPHQPDGDDRRPPPVLLDLLPPPTPKAVEVEVKPPQPPSSKRTLIFYDFFKETTDGIVERQLLQVCHEEDNEANKDSSGIYSESQDLDLNLKL